MWAFPSERHLTDCPRSASSIDKEKMIKSLFVLADAEEQQGMKDALVHEGNMIVFRSVFGDVP